MSAVFIEFCKLKMSNCGEIENRVDYSIYRGSSKNRKHCKRDHINDSTRYARSEQVVHATADIRAETVHKYIGEVEAAKSRERLKYLDAEYHDKRA